MNILECIKSKIVVSVQAMPSEPLYKEECMVAMMESVINGGAGGLRVAGARDIANAKRFNVPVIGITKPNQLPKNWQDVVYITPTINDVNVVINSGADIVAFDGTMRKRPDNSTVKDIINLIHNAGKFAMADISTKDEGLICADYGVDIISTTLSGYTTESLTMAPSNEPSFELLASLVNNTSTPVILEGRIWNPDDVQKAFNIGAYSVVIGSAITRPQLITKRFINYKG